MSPHVHRAIIELRRLGQDVVPCRRNQRCLYINGVRTTFKKAVSLAGLGPEPVKRPAPKLRRIKTVALARAYDMVRR